MQTFIDILLQFYSSPDPQQDVLDNAAEPTVSSNLIEPVNVSLSLPTSTLPDLAVVSSPSSLSDEQKYNILTNIGLSSRVTY